MSKSLLIVESPTKAKTLERYLGKNFIVKASVGHVKDLPQNKLGIDLGKRFLPEYRVIRGKKKVINELNKAAAKADAIYLGPDPDREGEAIAWHIAEEMEQDGKPIHRVLFYELTQKAIQQALEHPSPLNKSLYEAQQARRILDRLVGYLISPLLWSKVKRGLSAGRVQSVALRLVCERESEIQAFDEEEYWTIGVDLQPNEDKQSAKARNLFSAQLARCGNKKCKISTGEEAQSLVDTIQPLRFGVVKVEQKTRRRTPSPPFITSTLQQEAARKLRFPARRTMGVAQRLYEGIELGDEGAVGLITYMRTDSTRLSQEAVAAARNYIGEAWGKDYLPPKPIAYKAKKGAQDAHEAIRPTDVNRTPDAVSRYLSKEQLRLYTLIWQRFVACQMTPARIAQTTVDINAGEYMFRASGSVIEFTGFMSVYVESQEDEQNGEKAEASLPELHEGQILELIKLDPKQHFTQPPARFSEASLIKELEELGIGRPSTYAAIMSTILDREYVTLQKQRLHPTELGLMVNNLVVGNFPKIVDVDFTAKMENSLDEVERTEFPYLELLEEFYGQFEKSLKSAESNMTNLKTEGWPTDLKCPESGHPLRIKWSRHGPFLACSAYPECSFTSDYERDEKGRIQLRTDRTTDEVCDKCGRPMVFKSGRFGEFLACSGYPECKNTRSVGIGIPCPREGCDGQLVERVSKKGRRFYGCSNYPECKTLFWNQPVPKTCPACGSPVLLEKKLRGGKVKWVCPNSDCKFETDDISDSGPKVKGETG
ncbi:MAG: type I DNA topoisomerase [Desulfoferrobacter sp.]